MWRVITGILVVTLVGACGDREPSTGSPSDEAETATSAVPTPSASRVASVSCDSGRETDEGGSVQGTPAAEPTSEMSIADLLGADPRFDSFCAIVERAMSPGLGLSWLEIWSWPANRMGDNRDGVTVFAPTDAAFETLDPAVLTALEAEDVDNELLYSLIGHHYVHQLYPSADFEPGPQRTWRGAGTVDLSLDPMTFGGCVVVEADLRVANGFVHAIDCVVVPQEVVDAVSR